MPIPHADIPSEDIKLDLDTSQHKLFLSLPMSERLERGMAVIKGTPLPKEPVPRTIQIFERIDDESYWHHDWDAANLVWHSEKRIRREKA